MHPEGGIMWPEGSIISFGHLRNDNESKYFPADLLDAPRLTEDQDLSPERYLYHVLSYMMSPSTPMARRRRGFEKYPIFAKTEQKVLQ